MRILLFGCRGQLGSQLQRLLVSVGEVRALDREELDITDLAGLDDAIRDAKPNLIVNASAYTAVDRAEQEPEAAMQVNAHAPQAMARAANRSGAVLIHFSTDFVLDGMKGVPYVEKDPPNPLGAYGRSKLAGEWAVQAVGGSHIIVRTAWLYSMSGENFVAKVLRWSRERETLRIVEDQVGSPTSAVTLAEAIAAIIGKGEGYLRQRPGLYHLAGDGSTSRLEWAEAILLADPNREQQMVRQVVPARSTEFQTTARRPPNSALDCTLFERTFGLRLPPWREALKRALEQ